MARPTTGGSTDTPPTGGGDEFTPESAQCALAAACATVDLPSDDARLIRLGSNAVFRLGGDVIARVGRTAERLDAAQKQVRVARWLADLDYPAVRALEIGQPVVAEGRVVTFWESVSDREEYAPIADVAELIRRLHDLPRPKVELPPLRPFGDLDDPLPVFPGLSSADESYLRNRYDWAREEFPELPFVLPPGVVHGDANVGNVLRDRHGRPVLIDLDAFAVGAREWDLIQTALFYDRFGWHSEQEYRTFVDVYGYDLLQWSGYALLADMREVAMTAWMSRKAEASQQAAAEAAKRIEAMRSGRTRRDWSAY